MMRAPRRLWLESAPILATLVLSLAVTGWLTYAAWALARMHRQVAEDLLRGHALLAGQRFAARVSDELYIAATWLLRPTRPGDRRGQLPTVTDPAAILTAAAEARNCECAPAPEPLYAFRLDLGRRRRLTVRGMPLDDRERSALERAVVEQLDRLRPTGGWDFALLPGYAGDDARSTLIVMRAAGPDTAVYGFTSDSREIRKWIFKPLFRTTPLVTAAIAGRVPNDSLLALEVRSGAEILIRYRPTDAWPTPYRATSTLPVIWGALAIEIGLLPRVVPLLVPGGVPQPPVALLLAMFCASAGLLALAVGFTLRTHRLALLRSDFTSSVTHELRTPLTQILLYAETLALRRGRSPIDHEAAAGVIVREARRLISMVENILHFSRAERRLTRLAPRPQPIRPIVEEVVAEFRPLAAARDVVVCVEPGACLTARVDAGAVRQILLNLLDNAVRYGPQGQRVQVSVESHGAAVRLTVEDEGEGIPTGDRERVWAPFVRLVHADGEAQTGSGIGLAVVRELTELHGGRCGIESGLRGGARVYVDVPAA